MALFFVANDLRHADFWGTLVVRSTGSISDPTAMTTAAARGLMPDLGE
ncbi:MAG: hypothetical protein R3F37_04010 [Candidatus Competibacteraceae bacterium]